MQAALQFFKHKLVENFTLIGLEKSKVDPCAFFKKKQGEMILIIGTTHNDDCPNNQWLKYVIKKYFTIKELCILHKHLDVWYEWGEDTNGQYLEVSMEDFVTAMIKDFKTLFKKLPPRTAMIPALPDKIFRKNDGNSILAKQRI